MSPKLHELESYYFIWFNKATNQYEVRSNFEIGGYGYRCPQFGKFASRYQAEDKLEKIQKNDNNKIRD